MSKLGIFLDDERDLKDVTWINYGRDMEDVEVIRSASDFMFFVSIEGTYKDYVISFDHDIQSKDCRGNELTGYDCLKFLVDRLIHLGVDLEGLPEVYFHTQNPVGKKNMESYWNNFVKHLEENIND